MKKKFEFSSGNVFADLGLPNPEELLARAELKRQAAAAAAKPSAPAIAAEDPDLSPEFIKNILIARQEAQSGKLSEYSLRVKRKRSKK